MAADTAKGKYEISGIPTELTRATSAAHNLIG
jgi:hypothetical protein